MSDSLKKILYIGNIGKASSYSFYYSAVLAAKKMGYEFHVANNCLNSSEQEIQAIEEKLGITIHNIPIQRNPLSKSNITAYKQLCDLIKKEKIDYIHCNTPTGGLLGRIAGKKCGVKKVIYQAHGFHFYKGAPLINWLVYYPIERWLAHYTDALITINREDYEIATKKFKLHNNGKVYYVHGVGIDLEQYRGVAINKNVLRKSIGIQSDDAFVLIAVGRLDKNKNNKVIIKAVSKTDAHLVLCGDGEERAILEELSQREGCSNRVHFLGNRSDMAELYQIADVFITASYREGLSRSIMEAMASGLPCIVSRIRGNIDLIEEGVNGFTVKPTNADGYADVIMYLKNADALRKEISDLNRVKIKQFSLQKVKQEILEIYINEMQ